MVKYQLMDEQQHRQAYEALKNRSGCQLENFPKGIQPTEGHRAYCQPAAFEADGRHGEKRPYYGTAYANIHAGYGKSMQF